MNAVQVGHSFSSKEQASFNFMAAVTTWSDFGAPQNKVCHYFHCFPFNLPWSDRTRCHDLSFLNVEFSADFSLSSFTFIKRLFSSSLLFVTSFSSFSSGCWRWTGKPGVLQSMELQRVVHNWATELNRIDEWIYFQAKFISPSKNHI